MIRESTIGVGLVVVYAECDESASKTGPFSHGLTGCCNLLCVTDDAKNNFAV